MRPAKILSIAALSLVTVFEASAQQTACTETEMKRMKQDLAAYDPATADTAISGNYARFNALFDYHACLKKKNAAEKQITLKDGDNSFEGMRGMVNVIPAAQAEEDSIRLLMGAKRRQLLRQMEELRK